MIAEIMQMQAEQVLKDYTTEDLLKELVKREGVEYSFNNGTITLKISD